jgi:hypothetical protein
MELSSSEARQKILEYLLSRADKRVRYFKAKHIAQELGLSPKEVGANLGILQKECNSLKIEEWGYSKSTTWKVERS